MKVKARVSMVLELDPEDFPMPADGNPSEELEDMLEELVDHLDGTRLVRLTVKCTGGQLND